MARNFSLRKRSNEKAYSPPEIKPPCPEARRSFAKRAGELYGFRNRSPNPSTPTQAMARSHHRREVTFISRAYSRDPLERIESIGGVNSDRTHWKLSQAAAIARIESGSDAFFV